jgi:hypothetical protein
MSNQVDPTARPVPLCPLARDRDGNLIPPPDGMVAWRVRRKTGGRPRIQLGVDKQPMQLPPSYSIVDLEDILAPGAYLLDAVDERGETLGLTVAIPIGELRNADADEEDDGDEDVAISPALPTAGSETRLVLEANVRATQMAFMHNQKTLEIALRTVEALRDGVHVLADAQAEWIKSMASSKGFFRNAAAPLQLPPPTQPSNTQPSKGESERDDERTDDVEDDDDEQEEAPRSALDRVVEKLEPLIPVVVPQLVTMCMKAFSGGGDEISKRVKLDLGDYLNWSRITKKRNAAAAEIAAEKAAATAPSPVAELPPTDLTQAAHFMQIQEALAPEEAAQARAIAAQLSPPELRTWFAELSKLSVADAVVKIRTFLAKPAA